jgi:hypothetical protein
MIEVKSVIDDSFQGKTLYECLEAGVLIARLKSDANKGENNVFGKVLIHARKYYSDWEAKKDSLNDPKVTWYQMAAATFKTEYSSAIAAGSLAGYTKKELKLFDNACQSLSKAMSNGADFLERDEATGNFVLSGKTKVEQWNTKFKEKAEEEAQAAALDAARRENPGLFGIKGDKVDETEAPAEPEDSIFAGVNPELAKDLKEYCMAVIRISEQGVSTFKVKDTEKTEDGLEKATRIVSSDLRRAQTILIQDFAGLRQAANA